MQFKESWPVQTRSNIKFTMGTYQTAATFAPRGYKFRRNTPWQRLASYYAKPRMTGGQPKLFNTVKSLFSTANLFLSEVVVRNGEYLLNIVEEQR